MDLNSILENEEYKKLTDDCIGKTYYRYKLQNVLELDDFIQEAYLFLLTRIESFDEKKSSLKTFIPLVIMSCAKRTIMLAQGRFKGYNKLELKLNSISMDSEIKGNEGNSTYSQLIGCVDNDSTSRLLLHEIINSNSLTENQRNILNLMSKGYSRKDVSEILKKDIVTINITFSRIRDKILKRYTI